MCRPVYSDELPYVRDAQSFLDKYAVVLLLRCHVIAVMMCVCVCLAV